MTQSIQKALCKSHSRSHGIFVGMHREAVFRRLEFILQLFGVFLCSCCCPFDCLARDRTFQARKLFYLWVKPAHQPWPSLQRQNVHSKSPLGSSRRFPHMSQTYQFHRKWRKGALTFQICKYVSKKHTCRFLTCKKISVDTASGSTSLLCGRIPFKRLFTPCSQGRWTPPAIHVSECCQIFQNIFFL